MLIVIVEAWVLFLLSYWLQSAGRHWCQMKTASFKFQRFKNKVLTNSFSDGTGHHAVLELKMDFLSVS